MASKIFNQIFNRNISQFLGVFTEDSSVIFKDEQSKLIHPGEYGKYKEEASKVLIRSILDKHVSVSDGFVITADDRITKQCDIIVCNSDMSPLIADGITKMFPAEEVKMIGEIKSTLSRQEYIDALRKMAENKKIILEDRQGAVIQPKNKSAEMYNTVISFLICNKLNFAYDKVTNEEIYEGIERKYWHNTILSVEDATINYLLKFKDFPPFIKEGLEKQHVNLELTPSYQYPVYDCGGEEIETHQHIVPLKALNRYDHIKRFCVDIATACKELWIYTYDPVVYLGIGIESIFKE